MNQFDRDWLKSGIGSSPEADWSFALDAELTHLSCARESGDVAAVDAAGGLYLLNRRGRLKSLSRGYTSLTAFAWSDVGECGVAAFDDARFAWFDNRLRVKWSRDLHDEILQVALDPHGHYAAVSLVNSETHIFNARKKVIAVFETLRPLAHLSFVATDSVLVGAAEYGLVCCHELDGAEIWNERLWSNVGELSVTGDGNSIYLARFSQGIQQLDGDGDAVSTYLVEGTTNHVSTSFVPGRVAVSTLERQLAWLDADGELLWNATAPDDVLRIAADPLGGALICGLNSGRIIQLRWNG